MLLLTIYTLLENYIDSLDVKITWRQLANKIGIDPSAFSHLKKGKEIGFTYLLKISQVLAGHKFDTVLKDWCLKLRKPQNIKYALEYLSINRFHEEMLILIDRVENESPSRELLDYVLIYKILHMHITRQDVGLIEKELRSYSAKNYETSILADIISIYCKHSSREFESMCSLANAVEPSVNDIQDTYIRTCYQVRLKEIQASVYLYNRNDPLTARKYANEVISSNIGAKFAAHSYYIVGMSYLFEDYDECLNNIIEYKKICERLGCYNLVKIVENNDIPFVKSMWDKHTERPITEDISEIAHYEAKYGNKALALELLDKAIEESGSLSGYKLYYKAIAANDKSLFLQSMVCFVNKAGDRFSAQLPYEHLKDDPTFKAVADMLMSE